MNVTLVLPDGEFARADAPTCSTRPQKFGTVVPVQSLGEIAYLINSRAELRQAFADKEYFPPTQRIECTLSPVWVEPCT